MSMRKLEGCIGPVAMLVLLLALGSTPAGATIPAPEHTFYGKASVDGSPLFAGTILAARSLASDCPARCDFGSCTLTIFVGFNVPPDPSPDYLYVLRVPIDSVPPLAPGMAVEGEPVCFYINGDLAGNGTVGGRGEATRFDLDPVPRPGLSIEDVSLFEGDVGSTPAVFTVTVEPPATEEVLVEYRTEDGSATVDDSDYATKTETLVLSASAGSPLSSFTISVDVLGDDAEELDETFTVRLVDVENASILDAEGLGTIRDDDAPGRLAVAASSVSEGNVDAVFEVTLSRVLAVPVTVEYATQEGTGTATAGLDYLSTFGEATIPAGQTRTTFTVSILADSRAEPNETFFVELSNPVGAILDPAGTLGKGTIQDNERFLDWIEAEQDGVSGVEGLDTAVAVVVAPDGRNVYAAGQFDNAISIFERTPTGAPGAGELSFLAAVVDETGTGFVELLGIAALAISPDSKYLYAASSTSSTVTVFDRSQLTGLLSVTDVAQEGVAGVLGIEGVSALALSPDAEARQLYAASSSSKTLVVFDRDELSGALAHTQTLTEGLDDVDGLAGVASVSVSPDGDHVYVASYLENGVARFDRDAITGRLTFIEVLRAGDRDSLGRLVQGIRGAYGVAISPDGRHLYVTGRSDHSLVAFRRRTDDTRADYGELIFLEAETQAVGSVDGLDGASAVTVSLDGKFVYATGFEADAVAVFARDTNPISSNFGKLTFIESRRNSETDVSGIGRPTSIAVGPGDREVYVTGSVDDALAVFFRESENPTNPDLPSFVFSHAPGVWNNDTTIDVSWSGAEDTDGGSGVGGYSYRFIALPRGGVLDGFVDVEHGDDPQTLTSAPLSDGAYDFHLKTCDRGANCADELIVPGPFLIDATPPVGPVITGGSSVVDVIHVTWTPASDGAGSGLVGYTGCFDSTADTDCSACAAGSLFDVATGGPDLPEGAMSAVSPALPNDTWYFHICARDAAGNAGATIHVPVVIDLCRDADQDGFGSQPNTTCPNAGIDCDDDDPTIPAALTYYQDLDGDGFGDATVAQTVCVPDPGFVTDNTDCNDGDPEIRPGVLEDCENGVDDNCDDVLDSQDATCLPDCAGSVRDLLGSWNFTGPRVDVALNAAGLCGKLLDVGATSSPELDRLGRGGWLGHLCGTALNNFDLEVGRGYFLRSQLPTRWCEEGTAVPSPLALNLGSPVASISLPEWTEGVYTAASACQEMHSQWGTVEEIDRYTISGWQGHICGLPFNDFPLVPGEGYFVRSSFPWTWMVDMPPPAPEPAPIDSTTALSGASDSAESVEFKTDRSTGGDSSPPAEVCEIQIANVNDESFAVVWSTDRVTSGFIRYGTSPDRLTRVACDVRDDSYPDCTSEAATHLFVQVGGLTPETTYYVQAFAAGYALGSLMEVTTGPVLAVPPSDTTYGALVHAGSPVTNAYVCATVEDADGIGSAGSSALVCDLVSEGDDGYWSINLGNLRTADLVARFAYSESGDRVKQQICATRVGCASQSVDTGADSPSPTVALIETCVASTTVDEVPPGRVKPDGSKLGLATVEEQSE